MTETVVDEEAWLLASPQKPRRGCAARAVVAGVLAVSVLALAAVRGATPSRPAGRLYYANGQTFAELQTSLEEFEKEWHNAFPEELVAQWEEAAETYAAAWDKLLQPACPDGDPAHACVPLDHGTWHANWDKAFFPGDMSYPQTDVFEPNLGLWDTTGDPQTDVFEPNLGLWDTTGDPQTDVFEPNLGLWDTTGDPQTDVFEPNLGLWDTTGDLSTFEEMWSPGLQQWDAHFAPDVEPAIESALGGLLGNLLAGPNFGGVPVVDRNGLDAGAAASGDLDVKVYRINEDGTRREIVSDGDDESFGAAAVNLTPISAEESKELLAANDAAADGEGNSGGDGKPDLIDVDGDSGEFDLIPMGDGDGDGEFDLLPIDTGDGEDEPDLLPVKSGDGGDGDGDGEDSGGGGTHVPLLCDEDCEGDEPDLLPVNSGDREGDGDEDTGGGTVVPLLKDDDGGDEPDVPLLKDDDGGDEPDVPLLKDDDGGDEPDAGDASTTPDDNGGANGGDGVLPDDTDDGASQPGASGATSGGVAPTVKGPGYGTTQPGHDATGGFRPVLNAGPDLSEVTQPGLGQGNTFVTSWDDMRKK